MDEMRRLFEMALDGPNFRVIQLEHRWLKVFAQNQDGRAALVFSEAAPLTLQIPDGRGYRVQIDRKSKRPGITLYSRDPGANSLFLRLVDFIIEETDKATDHGQSITAIASSVQMFNEFAGRRGDRLTLEELRGVFAELEILKALSTQMDVTVDVISSWKGPFASEGIGLHDFVLPGGAAIEVKSAHHPANSIRVSSATQLRPIERGLRLVVVPLETTTRSSHVGQTLSDSIDTCRNLLAKWGVAAQHKFDEAIHEVSAQIQDDHYSQWKFVPNPWKCFRVEEGFPVIPMEGIPRGIDNIAYTLRLEALEGYRIDAQDLFAMED